MLRKKVKGIRQSYRGIFDHAYVVPPAVGSKLMKKDEFSKQPGDQIYRELNMRAELACLPLSAARPGWGPLAEGPLFNGTLGPKIQQAILTHTQK